VGAVMWPGWPSTWGGLCTGPEGLGEPALDRFIENNGWHLGRAPTGGPMKHFIIAVAMVAAATLSASLALADPGNGRGNGGVGNGNGNGNQYHGAPRPSSWRWRSSAGNWNWIRHLLA